MNKQDNINRNQAITKLIKCLPLRKVFFPMKMKPPLLPLPASESCVQLDGRQELKHFPESWTIQKLHLVPGKRELRWSQTQTHSQGSRCSYYVSTCNYLCGNVLDDSFDLFIIMMMCHWFPSNRSTKYWT